MQYLSVEKDGILYTLKCAALYNGGSLLILLFLAALILILLKGTKEMKEVFLYPSLVLLLTAYDPLFSLAVNAFFDINKEYYRFFWLTPVVILICASAVKAVEKIGKTKGQKILILIGCVLIIAGAGTFSYEGGYDLRENIYGVPDEILSLSRMIRSNTDMKYPVAIMDIEANMEIRQYDPSILLACDRTQYLDYIGEAEVDEQTAEKNEYTDRLLSVVVKGEELEKESFLEALDKTNTQFVVILKNPTVSRYLTDAGLELKGTTGRRMIFRYDLKDPVYYELADYSDIWEGQFR